MAQFISYNGLGGLLGTAIGVTIFKGFGGLFDWMREATASPEDAMRTFVGSVANGIFGGSGRPVTAAFGALGEDGSAMDKIGNSIGGAVMPVGEAARLIDLLNAVTGHDVPGYGGRTGYAAVAEYARRGVPIASAVHKGLFGLAALTVAEENPDLKRATEIAYRFKKRNDLVGTGGGSAETFAFRSAMQEAVRHVMGGEEWGDDQLQEAIEKAIDARIEASQNDPNPMTRKQAKLSAAAYLRNRLQMPSPKDRAWTDELREKFEKTLGEDNVNRLRDHDEVLNIIIKRLTR